MNILKGSLIMIGVGLAATSMASSVLHHHHRGFGLSDACGSTQPAICLKFIGDNSLTNAVDVVDRVDVTIGRQTDHILDHGSIGGLYSYYADEIDISVVKKHKITSWDEYFLSVAGKPVQQLCDVTLTTQDLQSPKQITMILHVDSAGNYTCQRS